MPFRRFSTPEPLGLAAALVPVGALVGLLGLSFVLFGDEAAAGPNQVALVFCAIVAALVAWRHGHSVEDLREAGMASVGTGLTAIFILLAVGALIGTWALSGTLIAMADVLAARGAKDIYAAVSHGALAKGVAQKFANSRIKQLFMTDTIEPHQAPLPPCICVVSVAKLFAEAIRSVHDRTSVSQLFPGGPPGTPL